jgi:benzoate membrane transport protein
VDDALIAGPMVAAYLGGRMLANRRVPPVGLAVIAGAIMVVALGEVGDLRVESSLPSAVFPDFRLSPEAILTVTLPMMVLVLGLGSVQALGFMMTQGYDPPVNRVTVAIGAMTVANAAMGGHPASMARTGAAMVSGQDAGPPEGRYWAAVVSFLPTFGVALGTGFVVALIGVLPDGYIFTMAGLAIFVAFQDSIERAFTGTLRFGSTVAFVVTLSTFTLMGIPSAFWALLAGIGASLVLERRELLRFWKRVISPPHTPLDHVIESMEIRRWELEDGDMGDIGVSNMAYLTDSESADVTR